MIVSVDVLERFDQKFTVGADGCWHWTGSLRYGYGRFWPDRRQCVLAHRWSYETFVGPIPVGKELDHLCRNRDCVNYEHLEPVTRRKNLLRGVGDPAINHGKTHCKRGHLFDEENTHYRDRGREHPSRICRRCHKEKEWERRNPIGRVS